MSDVFAPALFRPKIKWKTKDRDAYFRENRDVDSVTLAENLGLSHRFVLSYLQKLGLRPIANRPKAKCLWGTNRRKPR